MHVRLLKKEQREVFAGGVLNRNEWRERGRKREESQDNGQLEGRKVTQK